MFKKILVANRGEIALRIIRACHEMGIRTVAVYSKADEDSLHRRLADEAVCIGPAPANQSYLDIKTIIAVAELTNSEAIHPGYGFLAENSTFAGVCEDCDIKFIGPPSHVISRMGEKSEAKRTARAGGAPVVPGSEGVVSTLNEAKAICEEIGYPVMIKAAAGGGGKGMRLVSRQEDLFKLYENARGEAQAAFGNPDLYVEKLIINPRHIEVQVLADSYGNCIHLGERDCSMQRRHQKLLEESPGVGISEEIRKQIGEAAVKAAKSAEYVNAGTVEFLYDDQGNFYFMEMNTRIQVEHPVTEQVTGVDLVKEQLKIAYGEKLKLRQDDISMSGHAIECRINAEDPDKNFAPSPGKIDFLHIPGGLGIRVDTHVFQGYTIPPFYDSMIAKLIVYGGDRSEAILKLKSCLREFIVSGVKTTIPFHRKVINTEKFVTGGFGTSFLDSLNEKQVDI
ncbi:MAG: acetyl-CoA carboxylase biotin carboxylase subunit [candidate division Zixibacteria bacterium]|nr:acetyl-CoA carboxylase biotin carboxylase subunit [candidate division Zixibacteria bacterium]